MLLLGRLPVSKFQQLELLIHRLVCKLYHSFDCALLGSSTLIHELEVSPIPALNLVGS